MPSARRPVTCRARLTLAGASSAAGAGIRSADPGRRFLGEHLVEADLELLADAVHVEVVGRAERERAAPLELGLALAADLPEHVAEVVVDHRVVGGQLDGAQHRLHRLVVAAEAVEHPAEASR